MKYIKDFKFNIFDLNFILSFCGFALMTSLPITINSVVYRAFALGVGLLCIAKGDLKILRKNRMLKTLVIMLVLLSLQTTVHMLFGVYSDSPYTNTKNMVLLFSYGVVLIPILGSIAGFGKMHWASTPTILLICLLYIGVKGAMSPMDIDNTGRMSLNARQSVLALGDNGSFLLFLSACFLRFAKFSKSEDRFMLLLSIIGVVAGTACVVLAGSRGPFVSGLFCLIFIFSTLSVKKGLIIGMVTAITISSIGLSSKMVQDIAPVLFSRMTNTVEDGDMSGRDVLFEEAINTMMDNFLIGTCPFEVNKDSFSSSHNGFLDVGVGLGVIGFFVYILITLNILLTLFKNRRLLKTTPLLIIASFFYWNFARAMSGAGLLDNANYTLSVAAACYLVYYLRNDRKYIKSIE